MDALSAAAFGMVLAATAGLRAVFSASLMPLMTDLAWEEQPQRVAIFPRSLPNPFG